MNLALEKNILVLLLVALSLPGCEHSSVTDNSVSRTIVPISIDWSLSNVTPQNMTILVYREDGALYQEYIFENSGKSSDIVVFLEDGKYTLVAFNEKRNQIDYVRIRGHENLSTLEAYTTKSSTVYNASKKSDNDNYINQPGILAVAKQTITISSQTCQCSVQQNKFQENRLSQITLRPIPKTTKVNIKVHIKNIHNARFPILAELKNVSSNYYFDTDINGQELATIQTLVSDREFDESSIYDGTISASISTFGIIEGVNIAYSNLLIQLVDKDRTIFNYQTDISPYITKDEGDKSIINIQYSMGQLPEVKPEGGNDSGMSTEVLDWDHISVPIDL